MTEQWKPIKGFEGLYEVSNRGQVRRLRYRNRMVDQILAIPLPVRCEFNGNRYAQVQLSKDGTRRTRKVHNLVLEAFVGPCPAGKQAAHLDDNQFDNRVENLRWATPKENSADRIRNGKQVRGAICYNSKLTDQDVKEIRALWNSGHITQAEIAAYYGVGFNCIYKIVRRKAWKHVV